MKFRIYTIDGSSNVFVSEIDGVRLEEKSTFYPSGPGDKLNPFYKHQISWIKNILKPNGVILNVSIVPTISHISKPVKDHFKPSDIHVPENLKESVGDVIYFLIMDEEVGDGCAVFMKINDGNYEIISQGYRYLIIDELIRGSFIKGFGIDYAYEEVQSFDNLPGQQYEDITDLFLMGDALQAMLIEGARIGELAMLNQGENPERSVAPDAQ